MGIDKEKCGYVQPEDETSGCESATKGMRENRACGKREFSAGQIAGMMHRAGVRPSVQRIAILECVVNGRRHPSAEEIFNELTAEYPSMSRTTVYNALHALESAGLVRELEIESGAVRYDYAPQMPHSHFVCRSCGRIFDMSMPQGLESAIAAGFCADSVDVYFKGLCPDCMKG